MEYQLLGNSKMEVSKVSLGLMRIANKTNAEAVNIIKTALEQGINFFDHADIYGGNGKSEVVFAKAIKELKVDRNNYFLQSKVGIIPGVQYSFSKEHILKSVDEILNRLETTYLDSLLLHRPDMLWNPSEVAEAFDILYNSGKVRYFGVSNMQQDQIELLKKYSKQPIVTNQLQFSIMHAGLVSSNIYVNTLLRNDILANAGLIDYLRLNNITVQAWSPFQYGMFEGVFIDNDKFPKLNETLANLAKKYNTSKTAISVAWILKHPANIQVIIGTMTPSRIIDSCNATNFELTNEEWYKIFIDAGNELI